MILSFNEYFVGFGCMMAWFTLTRYIEHSKEYSLLSRTFANAFMDIARTILSVIIVFFAFALLGVAVFWNCYRFSNFSYACFTLFGLMLGDEVANTFAEMI
jgi:hypothetical protein